MTMTPDFAALDAQIRRGYQLLAAAKWQMIGGEYRYSPVTSPDYGMGDYRWCTHRQGIMVRIPTFEWFRGEN